MSIKNPFSADAGAEPKLKRNAYDLSRTNLFSTQFGRLTPCYLDEVLPGDSFEIDSSLAIQGLPTVFPLQTKCRVSVEFYYCRNRTVFDGQEDFIFKTKDIEQPWLRLNNERAKKMISTNSLGDMFGLPTTFGDSSTASTSLFSFQGLYSIPSFPGTIVDNTYSVNYLNSGVSLDSLVHLSAPLPRHTQNSSGFFALGSVTNLAIVDPNISFTIPDSSSSSSSYTNRGSVSIVVDKKLYFSDVCSVSFFDDKISWIVPQSVVDKIDILISQGYSYQLLLGYTRFGTVSSDVVSYLSITSSSNGYYNFLPTESLRSTISPFSVPIAYPFNRLVDATDDNFIANNPFVGDNPILKVNALPFRHYEQICNYYYRNDKNNPYVLNGEVQYNEFIPTHAPGADDNIYDFHYRNWELDRFTSAQQTPQFGEAPLVGFTFTGADTAELVFADADGKQYTAKVGVDGDKVVTIEDFSTDIPSANLRKLTSSIQSEYGLSINDLRVANSFQRFLENTMRRGLRYRNQLKSHMGVSVDYPDIDIPQYIGGYSGELSVGKITSTAQTSDAALGDFNGTLSGLINGRHKIHCYCPEHGYIIGIMSISPLPVYTQACNKSMIKTSPFDYALPEFAKSGFTPLTYAEVCPLQTPAGGSVNDVFGYQKLYYEYMRSYDEAHGYFRTSMKDFVLQRLFSERPELVADFTQINPDQLTDVFVTRQINDAYNNADKFLCNFAVHCIAKRQIPMVGTPSLE